MSDAMIKALIGPVGEGKTWACFWAMATHAKRHYEGKTLYAAIVRDTFTNLEKTRKSINLASHNVAKWSDSGHKMKFRNIEADLFGVGDEVSLANLQGGEWGLIWLGEPAPMSARANAGISEEVFNAAMVRCTRQIGGKPALLIDMNPADEDHWTWRRLISDPIIKGENPDYPDIHTEVFNIPYGENSGEGRGYAKEMAIVRQGAKAAYRDDPDQYTRYVKGKFSFVTLGEAVIPNYKEDQHRSKQVLRPDKDYETYRFWDGGLNPTCVFMQITPRGRFYFTHTVRGENIGVKQLIDGQVKPLLHNHYQGVGKWHDIGDPSMANRDPSDSTKNAARVIEEELGTHFEKGVMDWDKRRDCLRDMFNMGVDGEPKVQLSSDNGILHRCFRGGWHYKKDNTGRVVRDKAVKDLHSHPGDAVSHGIAKILGKPLVDKLARRVVDMNLEKQRMLYRRHNQIEEPSPFRVRVG